MNAIIVKYNPNDKLATCLIEALSNTKSVKISDYINFQKTKKKRLTKVEKSLKELETGKHTEHNNVDEYFNKML